MLTDGLQNLLTAAGSTVDPIAGSQITANCDLDYLTWYGNGGLATTIVDFWPQVVGSGIELNTREGLDGRKKAEVNNLIEYLEARYDEIGLLPALVMGYTQAHVRECGFIGLNTLGSVNIAQWQQPVTPGSVITSTGLIKWHSATHDSTVDCYSINGATVHESRLLVFRGRERHDYRPSSGAAVNATPLVDSDTVKAAMLYEQACVAAATILQKKNRVVMGVDGFNSKMDKDQTGEFSRRMQRQVQTLQKIGNLLNVDLIDKAETELKILERSLTGTHDVIDRIRDYLLSTTNNIPETRLFGSSRVGGLSKSNDDSARVNAEADRIFKRVWLPLIKKVNKVLLSEPGCPNPRYLSEVTTSRISSYQESGLEAARTRLINAQAAAIEQGLP